MKSITSRSFWRRFEGLASSTQNAAKKQFQLFQIDPSHPSIQFKEIHPGLWSARVSRNFRALAYREENLLNWFWIGSHAEYDKLIK